MSRQDDAKSILAVPLFDALMLEFESAALNRAVAAAYDDHEARQAAMADIRAVRNLRSKLETLSKEGQSSERKRAPA